MNRTEIKINKDNVGLMPPFNRWKKSQHMNMTYYEYDVFPASLVLIMGEHTKNGFMWHFKFSKHVESKQMFDTAKKCYDYMVWCFERNFPNEKEAIKEYNKK